MEILKDILTNHLIIVPLVCWGISQIVKTIISVIVEKKFTPRQIFKDGGMPSAHVATVISVAVMCGWTMGFGSPLFALAGVFSVVVIRDSVGVRFDTGVNARAIKKLVSKINEDLPEESKVDIGKLKLEAGHTSLQVAAGVVVGIVVAILYILIVSVPSVAY